VLNLESMVYALPEDVLKRKWAGDFDGEIELINSMLSRDIPQFMRERLEIERYVAGRLPAEYPLTRQQLVERLTERVPDFRDEELDALELTRAVEYIYVLGEKRYHRSAVSTMLKVLPDLAERAGIVKKPSEPSLKGFIAEIRENGTVSYRIALHGELKLSDDSFKKNAVVRCYLPVPRKCAQTGDITIDAPGGRLSDESAPQRTVYFERASEENAPFIVDYSYVNTMRYIDLYAKDRPAPGILYPNEAAPTQDDLSEQYPHIVFTPALKALAAELRGDSTDPIDIARSFYDYITLNVKYSYMRSYALIENQAEYCVLGGKGDCGIQALLFITLCRIAGIPARWQSGLDVDTKSAGCHDWAQFYTEDYGWLFCDPSFGGGAVRSHDEVQREYYFGNLDPFRMVANSRYQTHFSPAEQWDRSDPYDNQDGEISVDGKGLIYGQFETTYKTVCLEKI